MKTCTDCIHFSACEDWARNWGIEGLNFPWQCSDDDNLCDNYNPQPLPPVDVGDKVWYINGGYYNSAHLEPREIEVTEISKKKSGKTVDWAFIANNTRYKFSSIGKTVFLTKDACLAAINNRQAKKCKQPIV